MCSAKETQNVYSTKHKRSVRLGQIAYRKGVSLFIVSYFCYHCFCCNDFSIVYGILEDRLLKFQLSDTAKI